jgi:hypothetical protein
MVLDRIGFESGCVKACLPILCCITFALESRKNATVCSKM